MRAWFCGVLETDGLEKRQVMQFLGGGGGVVYENKGETQICSLFAESRFDL